MSDRKIRHHWCSRIRNRGTVQNTVYTVYSILYTPLFEPLYFFKNAVRCLPIRPEKDEGELLFSVLVCRRLIHRLNFSLRVVNINCYNITDIFDESGLCFAIFHL